VIVDGDDDDGEFVILGSWPGELTGEVGVDNTDVEVEVEVVGGVIFGTGTGTGDSGAGKRVGDIGVRVAFELELLSFFADDETVGGA
jgi:hypothetical protein